MKNNEYRVNFETITPLWFGNPLIKNVAPAKTSSLMGSLGFWFEAICYINGITKKEDYVINNKDNDKEQIITLKADLNQKEFQEKLIKRLNREAAANKHMDDLIHEILTEMKIPLPARVFGCTGWQGLIKVKAVEIKKEIKGKFALSPRIGIPKDNRNAPILRNRKSPKRSNNKYSVHYFPDPQSSFYGSFDVIFATDENTARHILFPLLKFVENYGFLGRAWNSGYGRVKVNFEEKQYNSFADYAEFIDNPAKFEDLVEKVDKKEDMWTGKKNTKRIKIFTFTKTQNYQNKNIAGILEELVKEKVYLRRSINDSKKRHQVFGTTNSPSPHGSKILPWIYKDGEILKCGFVSIVGLLGIGE